MKRVELDIDEVLKHDLPRTPQEEVDAAGERVLARIRALRFQPGPSTPRAARPPKAEWQTKYNLAVLDAVEQLRGEGTPITITLTVAELLKEKIFSGSAVYILLLLLKRQGYVESPPLDPNPPPEMRPFRITQDGLETLTSARTAAARAKKPR